MYTINNFDWEFYINYYPDLIENGITSKKNFFDKNLMFLKFFGLLKPFNPACVSPVLVLNNKMFKVKQIILPIKYLQI